MERAAKLLSLRAPKENSGENDTPKQTRVLTKMELKQKAQKERYKMEFEQDQRQRDKLVQEAARRKNLAFEKNLTALKLEREGFIEDMKRLAEEYDKEVRRRKKALHSEWEQQVFDPIQSRIREKVAPRKEELMKQKRELYDQYLSTVARKKVGGVYRDILIDDYDPLKWRAEDTKASVRIDDPLDRPLRKMVTEHVKVGLPKPKKQAPRQTVPIERWDHPETTGLIGVVVEKTKEPNPMSKSSVRIDHYDVPRGNEHARGDFPAGGKSIKPQPDSVARLMGQS
ncbi:flagellar associated protein [Carpediemonas membranifera]|uniref:Flagellar associated protein n=1 Tax=Carpediemonas membranifera TaxID=201153 RepID=A0A8J6B403_9EUKA|nr:flagellar associated protein [Carpediemonas membranifera]|eukprot:KAG9393844.1 flagellar associated protein [Carpediemonas membranifera]